MLSPQLEIIFLLLHIWHILKNEQFRKEFFGDRIKETIACQVFGRHKDILLAGVEFVFNWFFLSIVEGEEMV